MARRSCRSGSSARSPTASPPVPGRSGSPWWWPPGPLASSGPDPVNSGCATQSSTGCSGRPARPSLTLRRWSTGSSGSTPSSARWAGRRRSRAPSGATPPSCGARTSMQPQGPAAEPGHGQAEACQTLNLGPHPHQRRAGNRRADGRSCRSRSTVETAVVWLSPRSVTCCRQRLVTGQHDGASGSATFAADLRVHCSRCCTTRSKRSSASDQASGSRGA